MNTVLIRDVSCWRCPACDHLNPIEKGADDGLPRAPVGAHLRQVARTRGVNPNAFVEDYAERAGSSFLATELPRRAPRRLKCGECARVYAEGFPWPVA